MTVICRRGTVSILEGNLNVKNGFPVHRSMERSVLLCLRYVIAEGR